MARYAAKRDTSEPGIIARLTALGAEVTQIDGRDVADLLVSYKGRWGVAEVKTGRATLTPGQTRWARRQRASVGLLRTPEDAEAWLRSWPPTERDIASAWEAVHENGQGHPRDTLDEPTAGRAYLEKDVAP